MSATVRLVPAGSGDGEGLELELELRLAEQEHELLATLVDQLAALLAESPDDDPALGRLLPEGYRDDPGAAAEFRRYTREGLVEHKTSGAGAIAATLARGALVRLRPAEAERWLPVLTDLRLVLAERLGIRADDDRPEGVMAEVYDWLGALQGNLVDALDEVGDRGAPR